MSDESRDDKANRPPGKPAAKTDPAASGRRYVPPSPGGLGPPSAVPLSLDRRPLGDALGQRDRGRVTINFSGPPLDLPPVGGAPETPAPLASPRAPGPLALKDAVAPTARPPRRPPSTASMPALELDGEPDTEDDHDAWVTERKRRSTLPPIAGIATPSSRPQAATGAALQHRWVSAHQARARPEPPSGAIGLPDAGDALALADRGRPSEPHIDLMAEVRARYALDDLTGALKMAELVLGADDTNLEAKGFATSCRHRLELLYTSQLGPLDAIPRVDVPDTDIRWLGLDHRAGFLLSRVDGLTTLEELLDLSGMERLEALKTVLSLVDAGAIHIPR